MEPRHQLAAAQLQRMRGMNAAYHNRFFGDIRFTLVVELALLAGGLAIDTRLYLAVPVVALMGAVATAFDASYLIFSRQYATRLEQYLNREVGADVLIAHRLEDAYLFPLDSKKIVTLPVGTPYTWFGFMTFFYTAMGIGAYLVGLIASWDVLTGWAPAPFAVAYLVGLGGITLACLVVGWRWFVAGEGERRLKTILDEAF
jgi:hypothetical protein